MVRVSDYHSGGRGFDPPLELRIFTIMAMRQTRTVIQNVGVSFLMASRSRL
ncbi:hypothetical protein DPMN_185004 [Dreissena polymorpha]|uniref:Uncharacterized protein n=1 Tax=Dreissena polymorpha TaxID=45954 RepID=A0A9D4DKL5_DREPO|nr:hypothetical protein DPMN_185004 [Dreissena polymorpha]